MKLSDTQLILLSKAAQRDDRVVELPPDLGAVAAEKLISKLAGTGLIEEIEAKGAVPVWRQLDDAAFTLRITDAGLKAIGVDEAAAANCAKQAVRKVSSQTDTNDATKSRQTAKAGPSSKPPKPKASRKPKKVLAQASTHRGSTKHDQIMGLLRRKQGAALEEMQKVTGWQAHSVRGFLSGTVKKRLGLKLQSFVSKAGDRRYSIVG